MIKYNFQIDKDACFVYFIQSIFKWNWRFNVKEVYYYLAEIQSQPTEIEKQATKRLKRLLLKKNNRYTWLWNRYNGKEIIDKKELKVWEFVKAAFSDKFEKLWQKELPKLEAWKKKLENYDLDQLNKILGKTANFFGVSANLSEPIAVKLSFHYDSEYPGGHVKKEFNDFILLNVSNVDKKYIDRVMGTLFHETSHIIEYKSDKSELLKKSYEKIIKPKGFKAFLQSIKSVFIKRKGPAWRHLLIESVIKTMAGVGEDYDYFQHILFNDPDKLEKFKSIKFSYKKSKDNYMRQKRAVASRLIDTTIEYLDNNKEMDEAYGDKVAKAWLDFRKN